MIAPVTDAPALSALLSRPAPDLSRLEAEAEDWLRSRWPGAVLGDVRGGNVLDVLRAAKDERACEECRAAGGSGACPLGRRPVIVRQEDGRAGPAYVLRSAPCPRDADAAPSRDVEKLLSRSGLSEDQRGQTFDAFEPKGRGEAVLTAKARAMMAADDGSWLALAGPRGTGKSHLAVAVLLHAIGKGRAGAFRMVPEMLDDLRDGYDAGEYHTRMKYLKEVPCLVLDDLGKERATDAGAEWLFQILDARYRAGLQTIVTTNALTPEELAAWGRPERSWALVSRLKEMGAWVRVEGEDYRPTARKRGDRHA